MNVRLAILTLALAASAEAQNREVSGFSGTWVRVDADSARRPTVAATGDASFRTGDMGSGWGSPLTLTLRPDSLIVEYVWYTAYDLQPPVRLAFAADGQESFNGVMVGHATMRQRSRLARRDSALVITTQHDVPGGGTVEVRQTLALESPTSLIVETTRAGALGGPATTTRTRYAKH